MILEVIPFHLNLSDQIYRVSNLTYITFVKIVICKIYFRLNSEWDVNSVYGSLFTWQYVKFKMMNIQFYTNNSIYLYIYVDLCMLFAKDWGIQISLVQ